ncbi:hypothetical protein LXL04_009075 [Taraxacum kok-saghyz]
MDLKTSKYPQVKDRDNPFDDPFPDSVKETTDLVKLFPMAKRDGGPMKGSGMEAPPTPGRSVFSFSVGSRKNVPSKWDDAEKWLISGSDSPAHQHLNGFAKSPDFVGRTQRQENHHKTEVSSGITEEKVSKAFQEDHHHHHHHNSNRPFNGVSPSDVLLKDKFTNGTEPDYSRFKCVVPINEGFLFSPMKDASTEVVHEVKRRDTGTNTTPPRGSTASQFESFSPPPNNTPAMSGPLSLMDPSSSFDIGELHECHLAKLQLGTQFDSVTCNWSSREEEEEDVSKSLRHYEMNNDCLKAITEPKACPWEEEKTKTHLRYQREEAKIQAWVNLQNAKAEAQSRKLEVKIQKMRSKFEEKMMKKMATVHRKAEELKAVAQYEHNLQIQKATTMRGKKTKNLHESLHYSGNGGSCTCFPCNTFDT